MKTHTHQREHKPSLFHVLWGSRKPLPLPAWVGYLISAAIAIQTGLRGWEFLTHPPATSAVTTYVDAVGATTYGVLFLVSTVLVAVSLIARRHGLLGFAHLIGAAVYLGYSISILQGVLTAGTGIRFITIGLTLASAALCAGYLVTAIEEYGQRIARGEFK